MKHAGVWAPRGAAPREDPARRRRSASTSSWTTSPALIGLAQIGVLEIHTWNSLADRPRAARPHRVRPRPRSVRAVDARRRRGAPVRARLEALDLASFVKTTGGKGLHVVVPLRAGRDLGRARSTSRARWRRRSRAPIRATSSTAMPRPRATGQDLHRLPAQQPRRTSVAAYSTRAQARGAGVGRRSPGRSSTRGVGPPVHVANIDERLAPPEGRPVGGLREGEAAHHGRHRKAVGA